MTNATAWPSVPDTGWNGAGLPLNRCVMLETSDIDAVHQHMSATFCPHDLRIDGGVPPIAFRHNQASLKRLTFNATDYGNPYGRVVVSIPPVDDIHLVQFSLAGQAEIVQGDEVHVLRPGQLCILSSDRPVRQTFDVGYKHFTVKIPKADLERLLVQELGFRPGELRFSTQPVELKGAAASFAQMVRTVCDEIDFGRIICNHPRTSNSLEDILKRLLLAAVPHNYSDLFNSPASGPAPYYVRRVEEFIRAHVEEPIGLPDFIEVSGVSGRSLHAGFRRFRNTTPMGYLKDYRLGLAHDALKKGADRNLSVTEVALSCGFTHLSKFARDYQSRFGERPSMTLRHS